jgi:antitoxin YefM
MARNDLVFISRTPQACQERNTTHQDISQERRSPLMPEIIYSISEIREQITRLPEYFEQKPEMITVTRHGKPIMAILPWALYESIMETIEVLGDEELMAAFRQGVKDIEAGRIKSWKDVEKELGWE